MQTNNRFLETNTTVKPLSPKEVEQLELLTKTQLAMRLQKTPRCVDAWMRRGRLPYFKIGRSVLFRWTDVLESLNRYRVG
jgi:hypothetical protein